MNQKLGIDNTAKINQNAIEFKLKKPTHLALVSPVTTLDDFTGIILMMINLMR